MAQPVQAGQCESGGPPQALLCLSWEGPHSPRRCVGQERERSTGLRSLGCRGETGTAHSTANYGVMFLNSWEVGWDIIMVQYIIKVQIS